MQLPKKKRCSPLSLYNEGEHLIEYITEQVLDSSAQRELADEIEELCEDITDDERFNKPMKKIMGFLRGD